MMEKRNKIKLEENKLQQESLQTFYMIILVDKKNKRKRKKLDASKKLILDT